MQLSPPTMQDAPSTSPAETLELPAGVRLRGPVEAGWREILSAEALAFAAGLERRFGARRRELLEAREARQARLDAGERPDFLPETREVREGDWRVAEVPADLRKRHVEITGPVDRKMVINALNSGARRASWPTSRTANAPTWTNCMDGQVNLFDAVRRTIDLRPTPKNWQALRG